MIWLINMSDRKAQQVLRQLFIRCRKLNISLCFLTQSYFSVPKGVKLNCTHYTIFKIHKKESYKTLLLIIQLTLIINIL